MITLVPLYLSDSLAEGKARGTVEYRRIYLAQLGKWLAKRGIQQSCEVTPKTLIGYVAHLRRKRTSYNRPKPGRLSPRTLTTQVSVLRSFFAWAVRRGAILFNPAEALRLRGIPRGLPRVILTESEMGLLLEAPGTDAIGTRDRAILETLYSTGLRRAELCALDVYDVDQETGIVLVRSGKGGRDRYVPIGRHSLEAIRAYLRKARPRLAGKASGPALFIASITRRRLDDKTLNLLVKKYGRKAGLGERVTPHVLRHTCATHLHQGGADIRHIKDILGHDSVKTTEIYARQRITTVKTQ